MALLFRISWCNFYGLGQRLVLFGGIGLFRSLIRVYAFCIRFLGFEIEKENENNTKINVLRYCGIWGLGFRVIMKVISAYLLMFSSIFDDFFIIDQGLAFLTPFFLHNY